MIHGGLWSKEAREYRLIFIICLLITILVGAISLYFPHLANEFTGNSAAWSRWMSSPFVDEAWLQWNSVILLQLSAITALILGFSTLSGEVGGKNALSYLLSKPVSRREVVTTKAAAGLTFLVFYIYGSSFAWGVLAWYAGHQLPEFSVFFLSSTVTLSMAAVIYMSAVFFSSLFFRSWLAALFSIITWLAVFAPQFGFVSRDYAIFLHMQEAGFWLGKETSFIPLGAGIVVAGIFYELAVFFWVKREY